MNTIYHESYGTITRAQLAAYRKHNVSPSDHDDLTEHFGEDAHADITAYVKRNAASHNGLFEVFDLYLGRY